MNLSSVMKLRSLSNFKDLKKLNELLEVQKLNSIFKKISNDLVLISLFTQFYCK